MLTLLFTEEILCQYKANLKHRDVTIITREPQPYEHVLILLVVGGVGPYQWDQDYPG